MQSAHIGTAMQRTPVNRTHMQAQTPAKRVSRVGKAPIEQSQLEREADSLPKPPTTVMHHLKKLFRPVWLGLYQMLNPNAYKAMQLDIQHELGHALASYANKRPVLYISTRGNPWHDFETGKDNSTRHSAAITTLAEWPITSGKTLKAQCQAALGGLASQLQPESLTLKASPLIEHLSAEAKDDLVAHAIESASGDIFALAKAVLAHPQYAYNLGFTARELKQLAELAPISMVHHDERAATLSDTERQKQNNTRIRAILTLPTVYRLFKDTAHILDGIPPKKWQSMTEALLQQGELASQQEVEAFFSSCLPERLSKRTKKGAFCLVA